MRFFWNWFNDLRWTPPLWLRRFVSLDALEWISKRSDTCWAGMVMWHQGYEEWAWWPNEACRGSVPASDYCMKFKDVNKMPVREETTLVTFPTGRL